MRTSAPSLSAIARPAASSYALLMRRPDDSRSRAELSCPVDRERCRCAFSAARLVFTTNDIDSILLEGLQHGDPSPAGLRSLWLSIGRPGQRLEPDRRPTPAASKARATVAT